LIRLRDRRVPQHRRRATFRRVTRPDGATGGGPTRRPGPPGHPRPSPRVIPRRHAEIPNRWLLIQTLATAATLRSVLATLGVQPGWRTSTSGPGSVPCRWNSPPWRPWTRWGSTSTHQRWPRPRQCGSRSRLPRGYLPDSRVSFAIGDAQGGRRPGRAPRRSRPRGTRTRPRHGESPDTPPEGHQHPGRSATQAAPKGGEGPYAEPAGTRSSPDLRHCPCTIGDPCDAAVHLEECESGRIGRSRKPLWSQGHRGFESHLLRCCQDHTVIPGGGPGLRSSADEEVSFIHT
jgi:hypothetical protein